MAKAIEASKTSMSRIVNEKLGLRSYRSKRPTSSSRTWSRIAKQNGRYSFSVSTQHASPISFRRKKITVEGALNYQNYRVLPKLLADDKEEVRFHERRTSGILHGLGRCHLCGESRRSSSFKKGEKIDSKIYIEDVLEKIWIPWSNAIFRTSCSSSRILKIVQERCPDKFPDVISPE